jgi:hypothetical protein
MVQLFSEIKVKGLYVNKTYIPHYNMAIIYIYFVEYIFFYIFFTFG